MDHARDSNSWGAADEAQFQRLQEQRTRVLDQRRRALDNTLQLTLNHLEDGERKQIAELLIRDADSIRDALEPYDSGIRCAPEIASTADRIAHSAGFPERGER